jgi:hypothetical protein
LPTSSYKRDLKSIYFPQCLCAGARLHHSAFTVQSPFIPTPLPLLAF